MNHEAVWIADVLAFWFVEATPRDWWRGEPSMDERVRVRFASLVRRLVEDSPRPRQLDADGHVATVLVFDQFPRHLYRGRAEAFATDALARSFTQYALDSGLDRTLDIKRRHFLYMPLMHAEDGVLQRRSLALFEALGDADALRSARTHADTIARFGRFPERNAALGRVSTEAEEAFLARGRTRRSSRAA